MAKKRKKSATVGHDESDGKKKSKIATLFKWGAAVVGGAFLGYKTTKFLEKRDQAASPSSPSVNPAQQAMAALFGGGNNPFDPGGPQVAVNVMGMPPQLPAAPVAPVMPELPDINPPEPLKPDLAYFDDEDEEGF